MAFAVKWGGICERAVLGDRSLPGDDLALAMTLGTVGVRGDHQGSRTGQNCSFPAVWWRQLGGGGLLPRGPPGGVGHLSVALVSGVLPYAQTSNGPTRPYG